MAEKQFPICQSHRIYLASVPWDAIALCERRAILNHGQTLEKLALRGGLDLIELAAVIEDRPYEKMTDMHALRVVRQHVETYARAQSSAAADQERVYSMNVGPTGMSIVEIARLLDIHPARVVRAFIRLLEAGMIRPETDTLEESVQFLKDRLKDLE